MAQPNPALTLPEPPDQAQLTLEDQVRDLVVQVVLDSSGRALQPQPEDPLIADGTLDSLTIAELVLGLQERFGVEFRQADLSEETFGSIRAIARLIATRKVA